MKKNAPKSLKFKVHNKKWLKKMGMNLIKTERGYGYRLSVEKE